MDATVRELMVICFTSCVCLALAWGHEANYFAMFFAAAAAISGEEAIRKSRRSQVRQLPAQPPKITGGGTQKTIELNDRNWIPDSNDIQISKTSFGED